MRRNSRFILSVLAFGYAFLYIPLVLVIVYSFNDSRLATVWGGFSTRWYGELLRNDQVLDAAFLSLRIAMTSATFATILGALAGLALCRFGRFRGRAVFSGLTALQKYDGRVLFDEFFVNRDWPLASAVAIVLLLLLVVPIVFLQRSQAGDLEDAA